jgi:hypothetical protein
MQILRHWRNLYRDTINFFVNLQNSTDWKDGWQDRRIQHGLQWLDTCDEHIRDIEMTRAQLAAQIFEQIRVAAEAELKTRRRERRQAVGPQQQATDRICSMR